MAEGGGPGIALAHQIVTLQHRQDVSYELCTPDQHLQGDTVAAAGSTSQGSQARNPAMERTSSALDASNTQQGLEQAGSVLEAPHNSPSVLVKPTKLPVPRCDHASDCIYLWCQIVSACCNSLLESACYIVGTATGPKYLLSPSSTWHSPDCIILHVAYTC